MMSICMDAGSESLSSIHQWPRRRLSAARKTTPRPDVVSADPRHNTGLLIHAFLNTAQNLIIDRDKVRAEAAIDQVI